MSEFTYLGTVLNQKLDFKANTEKCVSKARKRLHMSKLRHLGINASLITKWYKSFIESVLTYHLTVVFSHPTNDSKKLLQRVVKSAMKRSGVSKLQSVQQLHNYSLAIKSLRIITSDAIPHLVLTKLSLERLSGIKLRVNLRKHGFRSKCISYLNPILTK